MRTVPPLPLPVKRALAKLGDDIRSARLRRRIPTTIMAARAFITQATLLKGERGDPGASMSTYAPVRFVLGMTSRLGDPADAPPADVGRRREEERSDQQSR